MSKNELVAREILKIVQNQLERRAYEHAQRFEHVGHPYTWEAVWKIAERQERENYEFRARNAVARGQEAVAEALETIGEEILPQMVSDLKRK